jgi:hypothetical protein
MANSNFIVQNGLTVGPLTIDAATGSINTTGTVTATGVNPSIFNGNIVANSGTASSSTTTGALVVAGGAGISGSLYVGGNFTVNGTTTTVNQETINTSLVDAGTLQVSGTSTQNTINASTVSAGTIGNSGATLYGTLNSSSASQTNITAVGTLSSLSVAGQITSQSILPSANVTYNLGSSAANYNYVYAVTFAGTSTTAKYADLAECYEADDNYDPGTVLIFGGNAEVTICDTDASQLIAGVVSTNPAYLMNAAINSDYPAQIALQGRVPTKVKGPITRGQMLVATSDGMARAEQNPKVGTVIGKALQDFTGDQGIIEVVVGRL